MCESSTIVATEQQTKSLFLYFLFEFNILMQYLPNIPCNYDYHFSTSGDFLLEIAALLLEIYYHIEDITALREKKWLQLL